MAAAAGPACLWLGARRSGHAAVSALAYPALGLLIVALLLAYSRGALLALAVGCALWFAVVPLRLRGVAVLATSAFCGGLVAFWAFASNPLSTDNVVLADRASAGHELGIALVAMLLVLLVAGLGIGFASAQRAPSPDARRQAGVLVLVVLALVPVAVVGALALSSRGLGGSLSNGWTNLTDPHANGNITNSPDRLTAVGSVRARYWNEALKIAKAHKALGVGAGGYATVRPRYRTDTLDVRHAHGYVVQTLADLGAVGMGVSLALLAAWLAAATRTVGLWGPGRAAPWTPERVGMATLLSICVVFGVHSFVDWTWFVPGNAVLALLCAGWLAGRGPTDEPIVRLKAPRLSRARAVADRAGPGRRRGRRGGRVDVVAAPARGRRGLRRAWQRRGAALRPGARADRPTPSGPTRCRSTCSSSRRRSSAPTATRPARAAPCRRPCATSPPTRPPGWRWPSSSSARAASRRRSRPSARPSTSTPARRRPSRPTCRPAAASRAVGLTEAGACRPRPARRTRAVAKPASAQHARRVRALKKRRWSARGSKWASVATTRRPCHGVVASSVPPQRSTRRTSASRPTTSATCSSTSPAHTTSKASSAKGSGAPSTSCTASAPGARARARRSASPATSAMVTTQPASSSSAAKAPSPQPRSSTRSPAATWASRKSRRAAKRSGSAPSGTARHTASRQSCIGRRRLPGYPAMTVKLLAVNAVDHPGGAEVGLLRLAARLRERDWEVTLTSPHEGALSEAGYPWLRLDVGGLGQGEGARAVASWPRALRLAQRFDVIYLNSTVCGRLLPALRGVRSVLHVHDIVDRVPRHWAQADVVLADSQAVADRLDGPDAKVVHSRSNSTRRRRRPVGHEQRELGARGRLRRAHRAAQGRARPHRRGAGHPRRPARREVVIVGDDP